MVRVPGQVFTPYSRLLISTAFVIVSRIGCLGVTGVNKLPHLGICTLFTLKVIQFSVCYSLELFRH